MSLPAFAPPPNLTQVVAEEGLFTGVWQLWLTALWNAVRGPANTTAPANSAANGTVGQIAFDANYLYICVGAKQWKRIALQSF